MPPRALCLLPIVLLACSSSEPTSTPVSDVGVDGAVEAALDGGAIDGAPEAAVDTGTPPSKFSEKLSEMDLYADVASKTIAPRNREFRPTYELWSDAADKQRWIALPPGGKIDTSDMDHWTYPVGTRTWKEFARGGKRLETRLVERLGDGSYRMGSYVWNDAQTEAMWTTAGADDILGTTHDVPNEAACQRCHEGDPGRMLGFSAIQLAKATGPLTLADVAPWLTAPVPPGVGVPGDAVQSAALGYLHANCAHCHNPSDALTFIAGGGMDLHLYVAEKDVRMTQAWLTTVNQKTERYTSLPYRIAGGDTSQSAIWVRMNLRDKDQMPTLGTEIVHAAGLAAVKAWIDGLPKP